MLGDDDLGLAPVVGLGVVDVVAVDEGHDVGVLLQTPRLTEVGQHRALVLAVLDLAVQLRERDDGTVELAGEDLQATRDLRHLDLAVLHATRGARRHQLDVVDEHEREITVTGAHTPGLGAHLHDRAVRVVVDEQLRVAEPTDRVRDPRPVSSRSLPVHRRLASTLPSIARRRFVSSSVPISIEKNTTGRPVWVATLRAIPSARLVLPMPGRAARITRFDGWSP